ncbi:ABC transporter ATP-binding protein [Anatilimnocola sp. NA78]|uniref:ABC transporter ATP-binding protein n=1 Tax=Anatilimnocola sp. NA78 TaxID=3415683 RepID=UPI003CE45581
MASLQVLGITKVFANRGSSGASGVQAVQQVDLEVGNGELLVLFGPSGSGKTTLLRMIAGLEQPSAGRILVDGVDVTNTSPHERNIALVFQTGSLYGHLSVAQNLAFGLERQNGRSGWFGWGRIGSSEVGSSKVSAASLTSEQIAGRVQEVASRVGIESLLQRKPAELSGGQQQRVSLAKALVRRPKLLLLDEPLASLDGPVRQTLARELKQHLREQALTAIHVTHDLTEALTLADRVAVLIAGQLRQLASPRTVYEQPADRQVAELFSPRGLNAWNGKLTTTSRGWQFATDDGSVRATGSGKSPARQNMTSRPVVLAIRAEDCEIETDGRDSSPGETIQLEVIPAAGATVASEWLGSDCVGSLPLQPRESGRLVFRWSEHQPVTTSESSLRLSVRLAMWFDETGKRITLE